MIDPDTQLTRDAEWQELREQHNDAVKNLKDGGPPVDHELLEDYVSDALDGVAKAEVVRLILTWKAWHNAENKMQHDIHSSLAEMGLSDPYSPEFDDALNGMILAKGCTEARNEKPEVIDANDDGLTNTTTMFVHNCQNTQSVVSSCLLFLSMPCQSGEIGVAEVQRKARKQGSNQVNCAHLFRKGTEHLRQRASFPCLQDIKLGNGLVNNDEEVAMEQFMVEECSNTSTSGWFFAPQNQIERSQTPIQSQEHDKLHLDLPWMESIAVKLNLEVFENSDSVCNGHSSAVDSLIDEFGDSVSPIVHDGEHTLSQSPYKT